MRERGNQGERELGRGGRVTERGGERGEQRDRVLTCSSSLSKCLRIGTQLGSPT